MQRIDISAKYRDQFRELIKDCDVALLRSEKPATNIPPPSADDEALSNTFFDLDRMWYRSGCFRKAANIVKDAAKSLDREAKFDTIIPIVSTVGAFGPLPFAAILAHDLEKSLVVVSEAGFGNFSFFPMTPLFENLLMNKRVLILKDVMVHATSVQSAVRIVTEHDGEVVALLTLIDRQPQSRLYDFRDLPNAYYCALLEIGL